jgi:hypothetical protein
MKIEYKMYAKEHTTWNNSMDANQRVIRECTKKGERYYTIRWFAERPDGTYRKRRSNKYVSGAKFLRDMTEKEVAEKLFIGAL